MTPHERKMIGLYDALADSLGSVEADTLIDLLPRAGWSDIADRYEIERPVVTMPTTTSPTTTTGECSGSIGGSPRRWAAGRPTP